MRKIFVVLASVFILSACAGSKDQLARDVDIMANEMATMQVTIANLQADVDELNSKNEALTNELAHKEDTIVKLEADVTYLNNEMSVMRNPNQQHTALAGATNNGGVVPVVDEKAIAAETTVSPAPKIVVVEEASTVKGSLYSHAYELYNQGKYKESIEKFNEFITRYPNDALANNSQYWIGENYYSMNDYQKSLVEFEKLAKNYPKGSKVPDALLKAAYCYHNLGNKNKATELLNRVVKQYPKSNAASLAKQALSKWG